MATPRRTTRALAALVCASLAGCAGDAAQPTTAYAPPQTLEVNWSERHGGERAITVTVKRLEITAAGWRATGSVTNATGRVIQVSRPHARGTKLGLLVTRTAGAREVERLFATSLPNPTLFAADVQPALPRVLQAGTRWAGRFGGPGRIPAGRHLRVLFGRFTVDPPVRGLPDRFVVVTRGSVRARSRGA